MSSYRVISSDNHVFEPADLWTRRIEPQFKDRAPHVVHLEGLEGLANGDWWYCEGEKIFGAYAGAQVGVRFDEPDNLTMESNIEDVRPGGYIPEEHVKDMDIDGIDVSIVYPSAGLRLYQIPDTELLNAICRTYNDWVAEFCSAVPTRLKGIAMLNVDDVQTGVRELDRSAKLGFAGAMITVYPPEDRSYDRPEYEPLWAAAQDLQMPLSLHIGTDRPSPGQGTDLDNTSAAMITNADHWVRMSLANIIFAGVFERYPKLQVGSVEMELSWAPHFLERMDYTYKQRPSEFSGGYRFKGGALPSDFFHSNVFLGFQEDALGIKDRYIIGVNQLQWGGDYPHQEATFPRSREIIEEILVDCTEVEKALIAGGNSARVYGLG